MPLFQDRRVRSIAAAALVAFAAYATTMFIPQTIHALSMMQSSVAMLALASLAVLVVSHHRRNGQFLTESQEEMILIGAFGLFSFAVLIALRAFRQRTMDPGQASETSLAGAMREGRAKSAMEPGFTRGRRPYYCSSDAAYCVVEEWTYF